MNSLTLDLSSPSGATLVTILIVASVVCMFVAAFRGYFWRPPGQRVIDWMCLSFAFFLSTYLVGRL